MATIPRKTKQMKKFLKMFAVAALATVATLSAKASDIGDATTAASGYVTAAIVVGVAVLLFTIGRKILKRLIVGLGMLSLLTLGANAATDIAGVTSDASGYVTAAIVVGVAVLLFTIGRKILKRLI